MTENEIFERLTTLYPGQQPATLEVTAALADLFDVTHRLDDIALMQALYQWRYVLTTLGPDGMTLAGMLDYEHTELPGVKLCQRADWMSVREQAALLHLVGVSGEEKGIMWENLIPLETRAGIVWLWPEGEYAVVEGVPLYVD